VQLVVAVVLVDSLLVVVEVVLMYLVQELLVALAVVVGKVWFVFILGNQL
jgi:hypothetical protein